jgi:hypothetical protein
MMEDRILAAENSETPEEMKKRIRGLYYYKKWKHKITRTFEEFFGWYEKQEKKCCYCGITEPEIARLIDSGRLIHKQKRGRHLEFERKDPDACYDDFDNLALACHWCNNAKTDTFAHDEFINVGKVFRQIWQDRLKTVKPAKAQS